MTTQREKLDRLKAKLDSLHEELIDDLREIIKDGSARAGDRKLAWEILRDNGVQIDLLDAMEGMPERADQPAAKSLPFDDPDKPPMKMAE